MFVNAIEPERRFVQSTRDFYGPLITRALNSYIRSRVEGSLTRALQHEESEVVDDAAEAPPEPEASADGIVTTEEEIEGYHIVRAIMSELTDASRIIMRDVKSYCGILLDDNNRQPICRLHFNSSQKYLGLFDVEKNEERVAIGELTDIYDFRERLQITLSFYDADDTTAE